MITEDYCSFELSELLREKGFDGLCHRYDFEDWRGRHTDTVAKYPNDFNKDNGSTSIPTHQMAMKWLREVHKISIEIYCIPSYTKGLIVWRYMIRNCETCDEVDYPNGYPAQECLIFEEAVEAALKYVLENLI